MLLLLDEFGKNLEAVTDGSSSSSTDPYLLQQLAELGQGQGLPIFIFTLQHQSFDDYLQTVDAPKRREWSKVQGRFEDIAYVESPAQTRALIGSVFNINNEQLRGRVLRWARSHAQTMRSLGVGDLSDPAAVAACWPLHPITALVLSELCRRYGQHERTLFSFLTGQGIAGSNGFLASTALPARGALPMVGLDAVYDYFVGDGSLSSMTVASNSRWVEIATRMRDSYGLSNDQLRVAKAVAMLNLISTSGTIRASEQIIEYLEPGSPETLGELEGSGLITFRAFADEYRIWQGTDVDIRLLLDEARKQVQQLGVFEVMASMPDPLPVVAARHSAMHDCLRVFCQRFASCAEKAEILDVFSPYDGQVLLVVDGEQPPVMSNLPVGVAKPTVTAIPNSREMGRVADSARELVSLDMVLSNPAVKSDWVARHEIGERLAAAHLVFGQAMFAAFSSGSCRWFLLTGDREIELQAGRGSSVLSEACDHAYPETPGVPNEMLNRTSLTSQGVKARRDLIEAMVEHPSERQLGLKGNGPEVAMYKAALAHTRLHLEEKGMGEMVFMAPRGHGAARKMLPAWNALEAEFERAKGRRVSLSDINAALQSPPIGMKAGVVPVVVVAGLLAGKETIAIYEHGTFKPRLTADMAERMTKNPGFFEIKHFASANGARWHALAVVASKLGIITGGARRDGVAKADLRVSNVLSVVANLVSRARKLDKFTQQTRDLTPEVQAVRDALLQAVEPDDLLFDSLPKALGLPPVPSTGAEYQHAENLASRIASAIDTLEAAGERLMFGALDLLISSSGGADRQAMVDRAGAVDVDALNKTARPFVLAVANAGADSDLSWIKTVATVVAQKSPSEWTDEDAQRFRRVLPEQVAALERLVALYSGPTVVGNSPDDMRTPFERNGSAGGTSGASAQLRVTVTRPDGREHARLVNIKPCHRLQFSAVVDEALAKVEQWIGSGEQARQVLLGLLGEQVLEGVCDE
ncbi:hypothetical protein [Candidatus Poriferisocius sp.]|uniref:hypothetical protein n=1 Tax=Candidatus Poriferisocius sp. TaxID=3101276 RepID=UPI003B01823F